MANVYEISLLGMSFEKARLTAASYNISRANIEAGSAQLVGSAKQVETLSSTAFEKLLNLHGAGEYKVRLTETESVKAIYKPEHASADENGFVYSLDVNIAEEMLSMTSATRAYEANIKAFNAFKSMNSKAMEIGK